MTNLFQASRLLFIDIPVFFGRLVLVIQSILSCWMIAIHARNIRPLGSIFTQMNGSEQARMFKTPKPAPYKHYIIIYIYVCVYICVCVYACGYKCPSTILSSTHPPCSGSRSQNMCRSRSKSASTTVVPPGTSWNRFTGPLDDGNKMRSTAERIKQLRVLC